MAKAALADMPRKTTRTDTEKSAAAAARRKARAAAEKAHAEALSVALDDLLQRSQELMAGSKRLLHRLSLS